MRAIIMRQLITTMALMMMMMKMIMKLMMNLMMMLAMMFRDDKTNGPTAIMKMLFRFLNIAQYEDKN